MDMASFELDSLVDMVGDRLLPKQESNLPPSSNPVRFDVRNRIKSMDVQILAGYMRKKK